MVDALRAAGGARPGVDLGALNLARVLTDGEQIVVGGPAPRPRASPPPPRAHHRRRPRRPQHRRRDDAGVAARGRAGHRPGDHRLAHRARRLHRGRPAARRRRHRRRHAGQAHALRDALTACGEPPDLRMALLAAFGWLGALAGHGLASGRRLLAAAGGGRSAPASLWRRRGRRAGLTAVAALRRVRRGGHGGRRARRAGRRQPADRAGAAERAEVTLTGTRRPTTRRPLQGRFGDEVLVRLAVTPGRGRAAELVRLREPVLVFGADVVARRAAGRHGAGRRATSPPSSRGRRGRRPCPPDDRPDVTARPGPVVARLGPAARGAARSVAGLPPDRRALVPALVDGDDAGLDPALADDFRTTGLTHLLAVSGTNLTLVVGFALVVARWLRVRGRWLLRRGRRRDRRVRAARPGRAERAPGRGDGHGGAARDGRQRARPGHAGAGRRHGRAAPARPGPGLGGRVRPVGARDRRHPAARARLARRPGPLAAALAGRGGRGAGGRPARVHAAGRGDLGTGEPGRGARPTCWPPPRSGRRPCWGCVGGLVTLVRAAGRPAGRGRRRLVRGLDRRGRPTRGVGLPTPAIGWGSGPVALALLAAALRRASRCSARACCAGGPPGWPAAALLVVVGAGAGARRPGWPPDGLADGGLRRRAGRRAGAQHRAAAHGRRGRRRPRPAPDGPLPRRARRQPGPAGGADPLPRRPRRRPAGGARRPAGRRGGGQPAPGPARRGGPGPARGRARRG